MAVELAIVAIGDAICFLTVFTVGILDICFAIDSPDIVN
jgi:hypothetical protein